MRKSQMHRIPRWLIAGLASLALALAGTPPAQAYVGQFLATFKEFPPRQKPGSFSLDRVLESFQTGAQGGSK